MNKYIVRKPGSPISSEIEGYSTYEAAENWAEDMYQIGDLECDIGSVDVVVTTPEGESVEMVVSVIQPEFYAQLKLPEK